MIPIWIYLLYKYICYINISLYKDNYIYIYISIYLYIYLYAIHWRCQATDAGKNRLKTNNMTSCNPTNVPYLIPHQYAKSTISMPFISRHPLSNMSNSWNWNHLPVMPYMVGKYIRVFSNPCGHGNKSTLVLFQQDNIGAASVFSWSNLLMCVGVSEMASESTVRTAVWQSFNS